METYVSPKLLQESIVFCRFSNVFERKHVCLSFLTNVCLQKGLVSPTVFGGKVWFPPRFLKFWEGEEDEGMAAPVASAQLSSLTCTW